MYLCSDVCFFSVYTWKMQIAASSDSFSNHSVSSQIRVIHLSVWMCLSVFPSLT